MAHRRVRMTLAYTNCKDILFENKSIGMRVKWPFFQALVLSNSLSDVPHRTVLLQN
jgi:hypothetical protein